MCATCVLEIQNNIFRIDVLLDAHQPSRGSEAANQQYGDIRNPEA